jgi:hypothetical protein
MPEIEEVADLDGDVDSGIDVLHGEFEDAPEDDEDREDAPSDDGYDEDDESEGRSVLSGLQCLWQWLQQEQEQEQEQQQEQQQQQQQQQQKQQHPSQFHPRSGTSNPRKRTIAEILDSSDGDHDSGNNSDSGIGGRIRRRKLEPTKQPNRDDESMSSTPESIMEMEL